MSIPGSKEGWEHAVGVHSLVLLVGRCMQSSSTNTGHLWSILNDRGVSHDASGRYTWQCWEGWVDGRKIDRREKCLLKKQQCGTRTGRKGPGYLIYWVLRNGRVTAR